MSPRAWRLVLGISPGSLAEVLLCGQPRWFWVDSQVGHLGRGMGLLLRWREPMFEPLRLQRCRSWC